MNMSIDPYYGRNPSFGFVELISKAQADSAMQELNGKILLGRPVKLGPGVASSKKRKATSQSAPGGHRTRPAFDRWTSTDESNHFKGYSDHGRRVWVGGLPKMGTIMQSMRVFVAFRRLSNVSACFACPNGHAHSGIQRGCQQSHNSSNPSGGRSQGMGSSLPLCSFPSADEAGRAVRATDGRYAWGVKIRVRLAKAPNSRKGLERDQWDDGDSALQAS